jgi:hypothetical protein
MRDGHAVSCLPIGGIQEQYEFIVTDSSSRSLDAFSSINHANLGATGSLGNVPNAATVTTAAPARVVRLSAEHILGPAISHGEIGGIAGLSPGAALGFSSS